jgi:O-antigen/teichoic acid export membrane protein
MLQRFFKSSGLYFLGNVSAKLVGFFMLPVFTGNLNPEELGYYDVANTYLNLLITFLFLDIYVGIMRFIYDRQRTEDVYKPVFNGVIIFFVSWILYTLFAFGARMFFDIPYFFYIYGFGVCQVFNNLYGYICRAFGRNTLFAMSGIGATLITAAVNFAGLTCLHGGIEILYIASMLGLLFQIFIIEYKLSVLRKLSPAMYDRELFAGLYKFSLPLCLNSLAFWILTSYGNVTIARKL